MNILDTIKANFKSIFCDKEIFFLQLNSRYKYLILEKEDRDVCFLAIDMSVLEYHFDGLYCYMLENVLEQVTVLGGGYVTLISDEKTDSLIIKLSGSSMTFDKPSALTVEKLEKKIRKILPKTLKYFTIPAHTKKDNYVTQITLKKVEEMVVKRGHS